MKLKKLKATNCLVNSFAAGNESCSLNYLKAHMINVEGVLRTIMYTSSLQGHYWSTAIQLNSCQCSLNYPWTSWHKGDSVCNITHNLMHHVGMYKGAWLSKHQNTQLMPFAYHCQTHKIANTCTHLLVDQPANGIK